MAEYPVAAGTRSAVAFLGDLVFVGVVTQSQSQPALPPQAKLDIYDLADAKNPVTVGMYALRGPAAGIAIGDSTAYISYFDPVFAKPAVEVVNITDLARPTLVSRRSLGSGGGAGPIAVSGNLLAVGDLNLNSVALVDASNPGLLRVRGQYAPSFTVGGIQLSGTSLQVAGAGYVQQTSGQNTLHQMFALVDVSDPTDPAEIGAVDLGEISPASPGQATVTAVGTQTFVAGRALNVLDVSDRFAPTLLGSYQELIGLSKIAMASSIACTVAGDKLELIDVSQPAVPRHVGTYQASNNIDRVLTTGQTAVLVENMQQSGQTQLEFINVADPTKPTRLATKTLSGYGYVLDVAVSGNVLYALESATLSGFGMATLHALDISDPAHVSYVSSSTMYVGNSGRPQLAVDGNRVYVANAEPVDAAPNDSMETAVNLGLITGSVALRGVLGIQSSDYDDYDYYRFTASLGDTVSIDMRAYGEGTGTLSYGYVGVLNSSGSYLAYEYYSSGRVEIANFTLPAAGDYYILVYGSGSYELAVAANAAAIPIPQPFGGLTAYDFTDPVQPSVLSTLNIGQPVQGLIAHGAYAYVNMTNPNLVAVLDFSDPAHPAVRGSAQVDLTGPMIWNGNLVSVAAGDKMQVIDVADPLRPVTLKSYQAAQPIGGFAAMGALTLMAADSLYALSVLPAGVQTPDLAVIDVSMPAAVQLGTSMTVGWTVRNVGRANVEGSWVDAVYLSTDAALSPDDIRLTPEVHTGPLSPLATYPGKLTATPTDLTPGYYYVIVRTDDLDNINEWFVEGNNVRFSAQPVYLGYPDLTVTHITTPTVVNRGDSLPVQWTVYNRDQAPAGGDWTDQVYLSTDNQFDPGTDQLIGTMPHTGGLAARTVYQPTLNVDTASFVDGNYYVIVKTNTGNNVFEDGREDNNIRVSAAALRVGVPELTLGTSQADTFDFTGQSKYYRVQIEAGQHLFVKLDDGDDIGHNELYIKYGSAPTRSDYDARYSANLVADQVIEVPTTLAGNYYILAYAETAPDAPASFTLVSSVLDFSILGISPTYGGNTGSVTLTVRGSNFPQDTQVRLVAPDGQVVTAEKIWVESTSFLYATFDLRNKVAGQYDVSLVTDSGPSCTAQGIFEVQPGQPPEFETNLSLPSTIRAGQEFSFVIEYRNASNVDTPVPLITIGYSAGVSLYALSSPTVQPGELRILATNPTAPLSVLPPGTTGQQRFYGRATSTVGSADIFIRHVAPIAQMTFDWSAVERSLRPAHVADAEWQKSWQKVGQGMGTSWEEVLTVLARLSAQAQSDSSSSRSFDELLAYGVAILMEDDPGPDLLDLLPTFGNVIRDLAYDPGQDVSLETGNKTIDPDAPRTFVIIHGLNGNADLARVKNAAASIQTIHPDANVIRVDWDEGAHGYLPGTYGLIPDPWSVARRIDRVGDEVYRQLNEHGVDGSTVTIIGESFGNYVGDRVADGWRNEGTTVDRQIACNAANELSKYTPSKLTDSSRQSYQFGTYSPFDTSQDIANRSFLLETPEDKWSPGDQHTYGLQYIAEHPEWVDLDVRSLPKAPDGFYDGWARLDGTYEPNPFAMYIPTFESIGIPPTPVDDARSTTIVRAFDPNDKVGPSGFGEARYLAPDLGMRYLIYYENDPSLGATAPAQIVRIVDQLDTDFDLTTFELDDINLYGNFWVDVSDGLQHFERLVDLRPEGPNLLVRVNAGLRSDTRTVTWLFESLDPDTLLPPDDAMAGFLPVNDKSLHNGEGHLSYTIRPKVGLASGTQITNQALNYFDTNEAVPTPTTLHTIDAGPPTSAVVALPAQVPDAPFTVTWNGQDDDGGSGIASYTIYVSRDDGPWEAWLTDTTLTTADFTGVGGHSYAFHAVAKDNVGHVENDPGVAEAITAVDFSQFRVDQFEVTPSGFVASFRRTLDASVLNLYDVQAGTYGPADVTMVGAITGPVTGSLLYDPSAKTVTFVKTGGPLAADTYTITLRSSANGFNDSEGHLLDGDADNQEGGDFSTTVTVEPSTARVLSLPDFARGPGQTVNVPATSSGIPIAISNGEGILGLSFVLEYDPTLLSITEVIKAAGLPQDWGLDCNVSTPGRVPVTLWGATPLAAGQITLGQIESTIPRDAPYSAAGLIGFSEVQINDGVIPAAADSAVQVVAYIGDATGNARYSGLDAAYIARVALGRDGGFAAYRLKDPVLVGDTSGNGQLSALDAAYLVRRVVGRAQPEIPNLPANLAPLVPDGPDPLVTLPVITSAGRADAITQPVMVDDAAGLLALDLTITYDTTVLDVGDSDIQPGDVLAGWTVVAAVNDAAGQIRLSAFTSDNPLPSGGGDLLEITYHVRGDAPFGTTALSVVKTGQYQSLLNEGKLVMTAVDGAITVIDNRAPTDIALSSSHVPEDRPPGAVVGRLATTDPDVGNMFTYALVAGAGDTGNASFTIASDQLKTNIVLDYETKATYSIRVRTTDQGGRWTEKVFTINLTDVNEPPYAVTPIADQNSYATMAFNFTIPGTTFADPDAGDRLTLSASRANGSPLPAWLSFNVATGQFSGTPTKTDGGDLAVTVTVADSGTPSLTVAASFTITVIANCWQNPRDPMDVNDKDEANASDVLILINEINANGPRSLPIPPPNPGGPPPYLDVTGDDWVTAADVLAVINCINSGSCLQSGQPEGEAGLPTVGSVAASQLSWPSQVLVIGSPPALAPAIAHRMSAIWDMTAPTATRGMPLAIERRPEPQPVLQQITLSKAREVLSRHESSKLRSVQWEQLLDRLAKAATSARDLDSLVDQVFTDLADEFSLKSCGEQGWL